MPNQKSIPLTLKGTGADLRPLTATEEETLAIFAEKYVVDNHPASNLGTVDDDARNYHGSIDRYATRVADSDMVQIGSFTNTFYNQAVGTHPGTSLSSSTTTTPLFQCRDSSARDSLSHIDYPTQSGSLASRIVAVDSDGNIREMDSVHTIAFGKRMLEYSLSEERIGAFRIGTTNPAASQGGTWETWNSSAFIDTTSSVTTTYKVYRKTGGSSSEQSTYNSGKKNLILLPPDDDTFYQIRDLKETAITNLELSVAQACRHARKHSELGKMVLLPSTQTPASTGETGTWQTRGTAVDTVNTTENIQYTSTPAFYVVRTEPFSAPFSAPYTGYSTETITSDFAGTRPASFVGIRTSEQKGVTTQFAGQRYSTATYAGTRANASTFGGIRSYVSYYPFIGYDFPTNYTGARTAYRYFTGQRYYGGQRSVPTQQTFAGTRASPARVVNTQYSGFRIFGTIRLFGPSMASVVNGKFTGTQYFGGGTLYQQFTGTYTVTAENKFLSTYAPQFAGTRTDVVNFLGERLISQRNSTFYRNTEENFGGERPANIQRNSAIDTTTTFVGSRQFSNQYSGTRGATYAGTRTNEYTAQFTGLRDGIDYIRNYSGSFSDQYTGETLTNLASTLETYTLYCKVSET